MSDPRPTKKQREVLNFISSYIDSHGFSPSYREVGAMVGIKSVSTVSKHIDNLIAKGFLEKDSYGARSVTVVGKESSFTPTGQTEQSFERAFVGQVEARILQCEQGDLTKEGVEEIQQLLQAMKILGMQPATLSLKRRLNELESADRSVVKKSPSTNEPQDV